MSTAVTITHKFVSGKADGPDPTFVQPSKWNQNENVGGGVNGELLVRDTGQTDGVGSIPFSSLLAADSLTNHTGATAVVGDVVALSAANDASVILGDTQGSLQRFVVARGTPADTVAGPYGTFGVIAGVKAQGAIARGQYVRKSATTLAVEDAAVTMGAATTPPAGALGIALTAAGAGVVTVMWFTRTVTGQVTASLSRLTFVNATSIQLGLGAIPLKVGGDWTTRVVPTVVTISNAGLTASTLYYVYAFDNAGVTTLELSVTGHSTDATVGAEIKTGDATRVLVGMIRTEGSTPGQFVESAVDKLVASWFNRRSRSVSKFGGATRTTTSATFVELSTADRVSFVAWADDDTLFLLSPFYSSAPAAAVSAWPFMDAAAVGPIGSQISPSISGTTLSMACLSPFAVAEGYHTASAGAAVSGGATLSSTTTTSLTVSTRI